MEPVNPYAAPQAAGADAAAVAAEQPLSLLAALNSGTWLYVRRFPTWAAMTLVLWGPLEVLLAYQEYFVADPDNPFEAYFSQVLADALFGIIAIGGTIGVGEAALRGERRGWLAGLGDGLRAWPHVFSSRFVGGLTLVLAAMLFLLPALYLGVRYALSDSVAVLERRGGMKAIGRSMELTGVRFLILLGLCLATVVPIVAASVFIFFPLGFYPQYDHWLLSAALSFVLDLLTPWMTLVFVAAYVQRRDEQRRETQPVPAALAADT